MTDIFNSGFQLQYNFAVCSIVTNAYFRVCETELFAKTAPLWVCDKLLNTPAAVLLNSCKMNEFLDL